MTFSDDAAFWVFNQVSNFAYTGPDSLSMTFKVNRGSLKWLSDRNSTDR